MKNYSPAISNLKTKIWLPLVVASFLIALAIMMWAFLDRERETNLHELLKNHSNLHVKLVESDIQSRLPALQRIVDRWVKRGGTPKDEFIADATGYIKDIPGFQAIEWVDSSFHVRWVIPLKGNEKAKNLNLAFENKRRLALEAARDKRIQTMTSPIDLVQGGKGFLIYTPIYVNDRFDGFLLAVIKIEPWLNYIFKHEKDINEYNTSVSIDNERVYEHEDMSASHFADWKVTNKTHIFGHDIQIDVIPTEKFFINNQTHLPEFVAATGVLLIALLTIIIFLFQRSSKIANSVQAANLQLDKNKNHLQSVLDTAADGILTINKSGLIQTINPAAQTLFGYSHDEVIGQNIKLLMPEPYHSEHDGYIKNYLDTGEKKVIGIDREVIGKRKDGSTFPLLLAVSEFSIAGQRMFSGIVRNISERLQAEEELRRSEERLNLAMQGTNDGMWDWTIATEEVYFSERFKQLLGYADDEIPHRYEEFSSRLHPDDHDRVMAALKEHLDNNVPYDIQYRLATRDSGYRWFRGRGKATRDESGNAVRMSGSVTDITQEHENQQALNRFKTTLDYTNDCIFMFDPVSLLFFYVNKGAIDQVGYSEDELLSMTPIDLKPEFDEQSFLAIAKHVIQGPEHSLNYQTIYQHKNGTRIPVEINMQYVAPEGEPPRFVAVVRDITERQQIEQALISAKQTAEEANTAKSEFLANMSHEIRTPMNGVLGMLELLDDTLLETKQKGYVDTARSSASSLLTVINDILDFSKIEASQLILENTPFDLRKTVEDASIMVSKLAAAKKLEVNCFIHPELPSGVSGDPVRLRQVLVNLITNAIKFTPRGEVDVEVNLLEQNDNKIILHFDVKDTGIGISLANQASLFNAFSQADGSTTRKYGGTGLGLSISKQLTNLMGGEIGVNSTEGKGSTFWFTAEFDKTDEKFEKDLSNLPDNVRVLAVDDNDTNRQIISHYLSNWKIQHDTTECGESALSLLREAAVQNEPYQIVILDYHMPEMDGIELARKIKSDTTLSDPRLIILSSVGDSDDIIRASDIDVHLLKPVRQSDIFDAIAQQPQNISQRHPPISVEDNGSIIQSRFNSAHVLIVDDMATNQLVCKEMLSLLGIHHIKIAADGQQALNAISKNHYDLVFMDCQMPIMDGFAATEVVRAQEYANKSRHLPIVALTANAMKGDANDCLAAGMDDYVSKPFTRSELEAKLLRWLPNVGEDAVCKKDIIEEKLSDTDNISLQQDFVSDMGSPLLDDNKLEELRKLVGNNLGMLFDAFVQDAAAVMSRLSKIVADGQDATDIRQCAHALKGISVGVGAIQLSELFSALEDQAHSGQLQDLPQQINMINTTYKATLDAINNM